MRYEYPTMIVTNTRGIFQRRIRRMKKMEAGQDSSDITQQQNKSDPSQFSSSVFLKTLPSQISKQEYCKEKSKLKSNFLDASNQFDYSGYSMYDIYENQSNEQQDLLGQNQNNFDGINFKLLNNNSNPNQNNQIERQDISYLVCDFDDMDIDSAFKIYQKAAFKIGKTEKQIKNSISKINHLSNNSKQDNKSQKNKQKGKKTNKSKIVITPLDYIPSYKPYFQRSQQEPSNKFFNNNRGYANNEQITPIAQYKKYQKFHLNLNNNNNNNPTTTNFNHYSPKTNRQIAQIHQTRYNRIQSLGIQPTNYKNNNKINKYNSEKNDNQSTNQNHMAQLLRKKQIKDSNNQNNINGQNYYYNYNEKDKRKDQTHATRNQTYSRYIQSYRNNQFDDEEYQKDNKEIKNDHIQEHHFPITNSNRYQRPMIGSPSLSPTTSHPFENKYQEIKSFEFNKKVSPLKKNDARNIKNIKQKALALLSSAKSHQNLHF